MIVGLTVALVVLVVLTIVALAGYAIDRSVPDDDDRPARSQSERVQGLDPAAFAEPRRNAPRV